MAVIHVSVQVHAVHDALQVTIVTQALHQGSCSARYIILISDRKQKIYAETQFQWKEPAQFRVNYYIIEGSMRFLVAAKTLYVTELPCTTCIPHRIPRAWKQQERDKGKNSPPEY